LQPCFRPHRSWDSSLQGLPLTRDRLRLSTQPGFLVVVLQRAETHDSSPFACGFPDVHAFTQLPGSPADYELPFHAPKHASRLPWVSRRGTAPFRQHHPLRSFVPSCESVRDWVGFPLSNRSIPSWVSAPLELSPSTPRILDPPGLEARTLTFARRLRFATQRTAAPCAG
jgi:hypothetical protein